MNLIEIFTILTIHWFSDFVLQTDKQAKGKSKNWGDLLSHTLNYTGIWVIATIIYALVFVGLGLDIHTLPGVSNIWLFFLITFVAHTTTDYFTSRLNSRLWEERRVHDFFVSVGFDQLLHYVQLFLTYYILTK